MKRQIFRPFWKKPPTKLLSVLFPDAMWDVSPPRPGAVHLTFDDGPSRFTENIAELLTQKGHSATFFFSGANLSQKDAIIEHVIGSGHTLGYHGHAHLDGWKTGINRFKKDFLQSSSQLDTTLYRPPYGRMTLAQYNWVKKSHKVVMWGIMPGDFMADERAEDLVHTVLGNIKAGSIVVLHDNVVCGRKVVECLPELLDGLKKKGLHSEAL